MNVPQRSTTAWFVPVALVALAPVAIGVANPGVVFDPMGSIDPFVFLGLGLDYDIPSVWSWYYKISRVPWIAIQYCFRHALPPVAAQYSIELFTHLVLGLALFFAIRRLLGTAPAFLTACFLSRTRSCMLLTRRTT